MNVSGAGASTLTLLDSVLQGQSTQVEAGVSLLKKAQDLETQQGQAIVQMLEQVGPIATSANSNAGSSTFNAYA